MSTSPSVAPQDGSVAGDSHPFNATLALVACLNGCDLRFVASFASSHEMFQRREKVMLDALRQLHIEGWADEQIEFAIVRIPQKFRCRPMSWQSGLKDLVPGQGRWFWYDKARYDSMPALGRYEITILGRQHFLVASPSGSYVVDLEAYGGLGGCTCPDFLSRRAPDHPSNLLPNGAGIHHDCPHLKAVKWLCGLPFSTHTYVATPNPY